MTANAFAQGDGQQRFRPGPLRSMGTGFEHGRFRFGNPLRSFRLDEGRMIESF